MEEEAYQRIKQVGEHSLVVAKRADFPQAIEDGHLPFELDELKLISSARVIVGEGNPLLLLKQYFPKGKVKGVRCLKN